MNNNHNGHLKIGNSTIEVIANIETRSSTEYVSSFDRELFNELYKKREPIKMEGELTDHGMQVLQDMFQYYARPNQYSFYVTQETYWRCVYALQGKHYPSLKRRMSKKWRNR